MFKVGDFEACGAEFHGEVVRLGFQGQGVRFGFEAGRTGEKSSQPPDLYRPGRNRRGLAVKAVSGRDTTQVRSEARGVGSISGNLFDADKGEGFSLIWSRAAKRNGD